MTGDWADAAAESVWVKWRREHERYPRIPAHDLVNAYAAALRAERERAVRIIRTHAAVQARYTEQSDKMGRPNEAKDHHHAYRMLMLAADDLETAALAADAPPGVGG